MDELTLYLGALRQAVQTQSRELQVVVELFRQVSERPFRAQPASWDLVLRQLEVAARFATDGILAFSVPEYMTPLGGPEADKLFKAYLQYIKPSGDLTPIISFSEIKRELRVIHFIDET